MMTDRLQAAWRHVGAELWRPLLAQFGHAHPDLPVEIVRTLLVRPRGMPQIFVEARRYPTLDTLHADAATSTPRLGASAEDACIEQIFMRLGSAVGPDEIGHRPYESPCISACYWPMSNPTDR